MAGRLAPRMRIPWLLSLVACTTASTPPGPPASDGPLSVVALSHPAGWLAEQIGGTHVEVSVLPPSNADPATWQPTGAQVAGLPEADLIVSNGAGFEAWTKTATLPTGKLVETARNVDTIEVEGPTHSHGKQGEHSHEGIDPHTWADPAVYATQAAAVHAALVKVDPSHDATYDANLTKTQQVLEQVGQALDRSLAGLKGQPMAANHPAYTYLDRRAGLTLPSLHLDPAEVPDVTTITEIQERFPEGLLLWWEAEPTEAVRAAFPDTVTHVVVDPLERPAGETYDYAAQARANAAILGRHAAASPATPDTDGGPEGSPKTTDAAPKGVTPAPAPAD